MRFWVGQGKFDEAAADFRRALEINPSHALARRNLDFILSKQEEVVQALAGQRKLLAQRPNDVPLLNDTAWILERSTRFIGPKRCGGRGACPAGVDTLRRPRAGHPRYTGRRLREAQAGLPKRWKRRATAIALARQQKDQGLLESINAKLPLYQAGTAYRQARPRLPKGALTLIHRFTVVGRPVDVSTDQLDPHDPCKTTKPPLPAAIGHESAG